MSLQSQRNVMGVFGLGCAGIASTTLFIAGVANHNWAAIHSKPATPTSYFGLWKQCNAQGPNGQCNSLILDKLEGGHSTGASLRAAQAFTILGLIAAVLTTGVAFYGWYRKASIHPWPRIVFWFSISQVVLSLLALIAFSVLMQKREDGMDEMNKATGYEMDVKFSGGGAPMILVLLLDLGCVAMLWWSFGKSGICGPVEPSESHEKLTEYS
eukprot:gb/GECG01004018.1/.p1 GENE.gb/GECG01004018.1/~~gb/GECG01004018.1/.p1  ORF type:complete len:212 (+),score=9.46 gb/GECG01004018.1/:1-636(+)